jgi:uncharacterized protein (DUF2249 family)
MTGRENPERVIEVAEIEPRFRHSIIGQLFKHLEPGHSLQIVVDHDPQRLRFHLEFAFGTLCEHCANGPIWSRDRMSGVFDCGMPGPKRK